VSGTELSKTFIKIHQLSQARAVLLPGDLLV
jgi:hypothetical protein